MIAAGSFYGTISGVPDLRIAQDAAADELLGRDPLALLIGMLLDQQFPMERAFAGPRLLADRLGVAALSAAGLAAADPEELVRVLPGAACGAPLPRLDGGRTQELCRLLVERYDGGAGEPVGRRARRRHAAPPARRAARVRRAEVEDLPRAPRQAVRRQPPGWREAAGAYGEEGSRRSVADITGPETLAEVRRFKQEQKQAAKAAKATSRPGTSTGPRSPVAPWGADREDAGIPGPRQSEGWCPWPRASSSRGRAGRSRC